MRRATYAGIEWHWATWAWGIIGWPIAPRGDLYNYSACVMLGPCTITVDFDRPVSSGVR
jgi:hypothetical protein